MLKDIQAASKDVYAARKRRMLGIFCTTKRSNSQKTVSNRRKWCEMKRPDRLVRLVIQSTQDVALLPPLPSDFWREASFCQALRRSASIPGSIPPHTYARCRPLHEANEANDHFIPSTSTSSPRIPASDRLL